MGVTVFTTINRKTPRLDQALGRVNILAIGAESRKSSILYSLYWREVRSDGYSSYVQ